MAQLINVRLNKGESPNLGFRLQGGKDFGTPLVIQKVSEDAGGLRVRGDFRDFSNSSGLCKLFQSEDDAGSR